MENRLRVSVGWHCAWVCFRSDCLPIPI